MRGDDVRAVMLRVLGDIAPEADLASIRPDADLREQLDLDSMDVLNFVVGIHEALGVEIPEADYSHFATLDRGAAYLASRRSPGAHG